MMEEMPLDDSFRIILSSNGWFDRVKSGLGVWAEYGSSRLPKPAARISAFMADLMIDTVQVFLYDASVEFDLFAILRAFYVMRGKKIDTVGIIDF